MRGERSCLKGSMAFRPSRHAFAECLPAYCVVWSPRLASPHLTSPLVSHCRGFGFFDSPHQTRNRDLFKAKINTMWFFVFATPGWPFSLNPGVSNSIGMFGAGGWGGHSFALGAPGSRFVAIHIGVIIVGLP